MTQLAEYARHEFRLGKRGSDGKSLRETLEVVRRMTGRMPEEGVNPAELPVFLYDLWHWFLQLHAGRSHTESGPAPITEQDIGWYFRNRRIQPQVWQLDVIRHLDSIALRSASE